MKLCKQMQEMSVLCRSGQGCRQYRMNENSEVHMAVNMKNNILKVPTRGSSEILARIYQTTWHYIPEDSNLCRVPLASEFSDNFTDLQMS